MRRRFVAILRAAVVGAVTAPLWLSAPVEAQYFGRNKVQYRAFDFQVIKTEHFDVYYYPQERLAAMDAARMVERSYARLSRILQHEFRERKPLILYASHTDFQQTNALYGFLDESTGGVTEALKSRMIVPFTGSYADFDHVMTHELVHGFQYDVILKRGVVSEASPFAARLPLWFMEGMAEYLSIGRIDQHTVSWLRDATLNGYLRSIAEMTQRDDYLSYRFGQSLWAFIGQKWGDEVVGILLQKAPRIGIERAFSTTLGLSLDELNTEWQESVRTTYLTQVTEYDLPERFAKKLGKHENLYDPWFLAPALSPDGTKIVYLSQEEGFSFDLWIADGRDGSNPKRLVESARDAGLESLRYMNSGAAFSHDGRYVAFASQASGQDALNIYDLQRGRIIDRFKYDLNGITSPSWAPDGKSIVFTGLDGGISDLFITDLKGKLTRLTNDKYADLLPSWSPDGSRIAFTTDRSGSDLDVLQYGNMRVAVLDVASQNIEVLPQQNEGKNINPVWSPDGSKLIWVSDRTGTNDLYLYDIAPRELSRITSVLSGVIAVMPLSPVLSWSQSGRLAFTYFENAGYNTYVVEDPLSLPRTPVAPSAILADGGSRTTAQPAAATPPAGDAARPIAQPTPIVPAPDQGRFVSSYYRTAEGEYRRASEAPPVPENAPAPVSVVQLLDSASMALPDTATFEHKDYKVKFTPDVIGRPNIGADVGGYYGNGVYGGSYISLSDMLGNHNINVSGSINGALSDASFFGAYSFLKTRANINTSVFQVPLYRYLGGAYLPLQINGEERIVAANLFLRDLIRGAQFGLSYPMSTYRRIEMNATLISYKSDMLYRGFDALTFEPVEIDQETAGFYYAQPQVAMVFDNSLSGWTGPIIGRRYRLQLSRALGDIAYNEALVDFRNYANYKQKLVLATRVVALSRFGTGAERFALFWGGPYYIRGYDYNSFDQGSTECEDSRAFAGGASLSGCPVRDQLVGSSAAFINTEIRVPVIKELQIGFLGNFPPVDAVAFFDGGLAWDSSVCGDVDYTRKDNCALGAKEGVTVAWDRKAGQDPFLVREPVFSYGVGLRINVFYTILRLDYSWAVNRPGTPRRLSFSFGPSF